jgi:gamma-glutamyltranspeptidase/glutathione hydrolase
LVQPAIRYAREGFPVSKGLAAAIRSARNQLQKDPASARLLLTAGEPPEPGRLFRNADLADLLETLARRGSVASFYRGDLGSRIAGAIRKHGGLVTAEDLAAYQAREVKPLRFDWRGFAVYTAPLTAGGLTVLQMLGVLKALGWETRPLDDPRTTHAFLEAQRVAWDDRLRWLGDPEKGTVPVERLLSDRHARETAARVDAAVKEGKPVPASAGGPTADGTIHLSVADRQGNLVALTLTHGGAFGAQVTVDGLGLILGHGMSRFEARPGHPNSPGPGKRPLHNMCPTVVLRDGKPILAVGGAGGRRIPNAICTMLAHYVGRGQPVADAVAAARLHTEGGLGITADKSWPEPHEQYLRRMGYDVRPGSVAVVHAVGLEPEAGTARAASR